jgi:hypothetical protein
MGPVDAHKDDTDLIVVHGIYYRSQHLALQEKTSKPPTHSKAFWRLGEVIVQGREGERREGAGRVTSAF